VGCGDRPVPIGSQKRRAERNKHLLSHLFSLMLGLRFLSNFQDCVGGGKEAIC
jgi:hypothetical protein